MTPGMDPGGKTTICTPCREETMRTGTALSTAVFLIGTTVAFSARAQAQRDRFRINGQPNPEQPATVDPRTGRAPSPPRFTEAPVGFDNLTNGYLPQGPDFDSLDEDNVV